MYVYSRESSLDMIRLKTFLHLSTLRKYTERKIQDDDNKTILKSQARLANWGWPQSTAAHLHASCWAACVCSAHNTSDTSQEGTELFTGNHLLQGPASPPPDPGDVPFPPHLSSEAYLAPRQPAKKLIQVGIRNTDSQTPWLGQTVPPSILELNFREFWFYLYRG